MSENSKMIRPPDDGCFPSYYPSDRDIAIQLLGVASQLLNRKYQKWDMPPVYVPMDMDAKEKEKLRLSYMPPPPPPPPPPDDERCFPLYPSDRDIAIQLMNTATQLLNRKYNKWDIPGIYPLSEDPPDA